MAFTTALKRALAALHVVRYGSLTLRGTPSLAPAPHVTTPLARFSLLSPMCPQLLPIQLTHSIPTITTINDVAAALGTFDPFEYSLYRNSNVSPTHDFISPSDALKPPCLENDSWMLPFWRPANAHSFQQTAFILLVLVVFGVLLTSLATTFRLKHKLNAARTANNSLAKSSTKQTSTIYRLEAENSVLQETNVQLEDRLSTRGGDKVILQLDLQSARVSLEKEVTRSKHAEGRTRIAELEVVRLKSELAEYQQTSRRELEFFNQQASDLQEQLQDAAQVKEKADIEIKDLKEQLTISQHKGEDTLEDLTSAVLEMDMDHQSTIRDLRGTVAALESTLATAETVKTAALAEIDNLLNKLHSAMESRDHALEIQRDQIMELVAKQTEISLLQRQNSELKTAKRERRHEVETLRALLENTNQSKASLAARASRVQESMRSTINNLRLTSSYQQNTIEDLRNRGERRQKVSLASNAAEQQWAEALDALVQTINDRASARDLNSPEPSTRLCISEEDNASTLSCESEPTLDELSVTANPVSAAEASTPPAPPPEDLPVSPLMQLESSNTTSPHSDNGTFALSAMDDTSLVMDEDVHSSLFRQSGSWESQLAVITPQISLQSASSETVTMPRSMARPKSASSSKHGSLLPTPTSRSTRQTSPHLLLHDLDVSPD